MSASSKERWMRFPTDFLHYQLSMDFLVRIFTVIMTNAGST